MERPFAPATLRPDCVAAIDTGKRGLTNTAILTPPPLQYDLSSCIHFFFYTCRLVVLLCRGCQHRDDTPPNGRRGLAEEPWNAPSLPQPCARIAWRRPPRSRQVWSYQHRNSQPPPLQYDLSSCIHFFFYTCRLVVLLCRGCQHRDDTPPKGRRGLAENQSDGTVRVHDGRSWRLT